MHITALSRLIVRTRQEQLISTYMHGYRPFVAARYPTRRLTLSTINDSPSSLHRIIPSSANSLRSIIVHNFFKNAGICMSLTRTSSSEPTAADAGGVLPPDFPPPEALFPPFFPAFLLALPLIMQCFGQSRGVPRL